jgi:hypothetical protein
MQNMQPCTQLTENYKDLNSSFLYNPSTETQIQLAKSFLEFPVVSASELFG